MLYNLLYRVLITPWVNIPKIYNKKNLANQKNFVVSNLQVYNRRVIISKVMHTKVFCLKKCYFYFDRVYFDNMSEKCGFQQFQIN